MLLVEGNVERRARLSRALMAAGLSVRAVGGIAEVERWPAGDVVVTDSRRFTPFWKETGAAHVVVLADSTEEGTDACRRGASGWVPRHASPRALIDLLDELGVLDAAPASRDEHVQ